MNTQADSSLITVTVRLFASLRERLGWSEKVLQVEAGCRVDQVWALAVEEALPANTLAAVNMEYVSAETPVQDGDEVAFFPPVTGG